MVPTRDGELPWWVDEVPLLSCSCSQSAKFRRYTSPDEHPFTPLDQLPKPILPAQNYPQLLHTPAASHPSTNVNHRILDFYVNKIVPVITRGEGRLEDDGNYGSTATRDVEVLQALSRRIHFGKLLSFLPEIRILTIGMFVSESKFLDAPHLFIPHILSKPPNTEALTSLIYKPEVEARLLVRLANKAKVYGGEFDAEGRVVEVSGSRGKIDIDGVVGMYRDYVIPLTKDVEVGVMSASGWLIFQVDYLIHRLDDVPQSQVDAWMAGAAEAAKA